MNVVRTSVDHNINTTGISAGCLIEKEEDILADAKKGIGLLAVVASSGGPTALTLESVVVQTGGISERTATGKGLVKREQSDKFRNAPPNAQKPPHGIGVIMHSLVLPQVFEVGKLDIAGLRSQRYVETTKGMTSPNIITDMNITTKIWFVPQVFRTDVTDRTT